MITGETKSGFRYELDEKNMDDYELLENLCDIDNGDIAKIPATARQLLGDEQLKALKDHVRNEEGRVSANKMFEEISQILGESKEGKNS